MNFKLNKQRGGAGADLMPIVGIFVLLFFIWLSTGGPEKVEDRQGNLLNNSTISTNSTNRESIEEYDPAEGLVTLNGVTYLRSPWYGQIKIGRGTARSEYQPRKEYITLTTSYRNEESILITGWILENGDGLKLQSVGSNVYKTNSKRVVIPSGVNSEQL